MNIVDVAFSVVATESLPADHGYALYGALSRVLPAIHRENGIAIHPIRGRQVGERRMVLVPSSRLVLRTLASRIPELIPLAGASISLRGVRITIGVPEIRVLSPAPVLRSRLVVIKQATAASAADVNAGNFKAAARRQLNSLGVSPQVQLTVGKRRTLRLKQKEVVGYEVILNGLAPSESLAVQAEGIGGRRHMGCGVFVPVAAAQEART